MFSILMPMLLTAAAVADVNYPDALPDIDAPESMRASFNAPFTPKVADGYFRQFTSVQPSEQRQCTSGYRFYGDRFDVATRPAYLEKAAGGREAGAPVVDRESAAAVYHTRLLDIYGYFVKFRVLAVREEWQDDRGFMVNFAGAGLQGGTYGFSVFQSIAAEDRFGPSRITAGMYLNNGGSILSFQLTGSGSERRLLNVGGLRYDGAFWLNRYDTRLRKYQRTFFVGASEALRVGVNTSRPVATLDVEGFMRLRRQDRRPACNGAADGALTLGEQGMICVCNSSRWVSSGDGKTACGEAGK